MPAYFPPEKLQFFDETGGVGMAFSKLPFDHLLFTGSGTTGRAVMAAAAQNLCPVTLELGGKAPAIVCDDFPLQLAAERILFVKCLNAGQICTTVDHPGCRGRIGEFVQSWRRPSCRRATPAWLRPTTPPSSTSAFDRLLQALDDARAARRHGGAAAARPGLRRRTRKIAPHIVLDAPPTAADAARDLRPHPADPWLRPAGRGGRSVNAGPRPAGDLPLQPRPRRVQMLLDRVMSGGVSVNDACSTSASTTCPLAAWASRAWATTTAARAFDLLQAAAGLLPGALQFDEVPDAALRQVRGLVAVRQLPW
jgi:coniferyl-aldehyde dehydrogenase